jgi:hypothetical protein
MPIAKLFHLSGRVAVATGGSVRHVPWPKPGLRSPSLLIVRRRTNVSRRKFSDCGGYYGQSNLQGRWNLSVASHKLYKLRYCLAKDFSAAFQDTLNTQRPSRSNINSGIYS